MIIIKTVEEIAAMKKANFIVSEVLYTLKARAGPGVTTSELNELAEKRCKELGGIPGFKGYKGFPYSICASVNNVIVHGFPNDIPLRDGDTLSIDFGAIYDGWYGDSAFTVGIGKVESAVECLISSCKKCLFAGIKQAIQGNRIGDISNAIETLAHSNGYNVIENFVGHGIGRNLHEAPQIPNYGEKGKGHRIKNGFVIAIEPMLVMGDNKTKTLPDGWGIATKDNSLAVHFEHTVAVTKDGPQILTLRPDEFKED